MNEKIRASVLAGTWYPGDPDELKRAINYYLKKVKPPKIKQTIHGLISPHAGYIYSGQTAAYGYKELENKEYDHVVVLAPLHQLPMGKYAINRADYYETPLGRIPVNKTFVKELSKKIDITFVDHEEEHAIEIQLPFLQMVLPEFQILPIMIGFSDLNECDDLVLGLSQIIKNSKNLILISTDMHHIANYYEVVRKDQDVINTIQSFDIKRISERLKQSDCSVCGRVGMLIGLRVLKGLGSKSIQILHYTNSGDVTGERMAGHYTVGYLSAAII